MIELILDTQRPFFDKLAEEWQASGASFFSICKHNTVLVNWQNREGDIEPSYVETIQINQVYLGELRLGGIQSTTAQQLLKNQATFLSTIIRQEQEINSIVTTLVDTQDRLWALHRLTKVTRNYLDMEDLLLALVAESANLMLTSGAFIWLDFDKGETLFYQSPKTTLACEDVHHLVNRLSETQAEFLCYRDVPTTDKIDNILLVPMTVRFATRVVFGVYNKNSMFKTPDIKLAGAIADYAGSQVENVISYQDSLEKAQLRHEMELAQRVQVQLFPNGLPQLSGLDFWATSKPASHVGGDFYDYFVHKDGKLTFTVGDVAGKGIASALLMAMTRTIMQAQLNEFENLSPGRIIEKTNEQLFNDFTRVNMFATIFVGQYDPDTKRLLFVNAGHSPVIYFSKGNAPLFLEAENTPIGILKRSVAVERELFLNDGDLLFVGSDGLYEAQNEDEAFFGFERLERYLLALRFCSAQEIGEKILDIIASFSAQDFQDDDRTIMILKPTDKMVQQ